MQKVLIALDYDPTALKIAEKGYALAKTMKAEVTLLHVIASPIYYSSLEYSPILGLNNSMGMSAFQLDTLEGLKNAAQHFVDKTKRSLGDETIQTIIKEGETAEAILKSAKKMKADIIVMGSHSRKWLENIIMGSVTEDVLNKTKIPLFIIPTKNPKK